MARTCDVTNSRGAGKDQEPIKVPTATGVATHQNGAFSENKVPCAGKVPIMRVRNIREVSIRASRESSHQIFTVVVDLWLL